MVSEETSLSPWLSSSRTIFDTASSMRSGSTRRLRNAICTERRSLSRSNGTRRPLRLITMSSRNCTRSKVVKRKLQARQTRRRRMTELSSVGRESFTWVSRLPQLGQRMARSARTTVDGQPRTDRRRPCVRSVLRPLSFVSINRKSGDERLDLFAHGGLDRRIGFHVLMGKYVKHLHDKLADFLEFANAKAARRACRSAQTYSRRDCRLLRVKRNTVLVAGDVRPPERRLRHPAGKALGPQID